MDGKEIETSRETVTVISPLDCIEACVDPLSRLQFQCLSALYYYQVISF